MAPHGVLRVQDMVDPAGVIQVSYHHPKIEDFGKIDRQVYNVTSPPTGEEPGPIPGAAPGATGGDGGSFAGLLGIATGIAALVSGRSSSETEPAVGPGEHEEEAGSSN